MSTLYCFRSPRLWLGLTLFCLTLTMATAQTIRYVKPVATGTGDGSSWANAASTLQRIIDRSAPDDQVWVAAGLYKPTRIPPGLDPTNEQNKTFFFSNGVKVFGGFDGTETAPDQRDLTGPSSTTLSGDIGKSSNTGKLITVVTIRGSSKTQLDGLFIADGVFRNDGSSQYSPQITGSQPLVQNCSFFNPSSAAISELSGSTASGGKYVNCFMFGSATGIFCTVDGGICSPTFINCKISGNGYGLANYVYDNGISTPTFINCSLTGNSSYALSNSFYQNGTLNLKLTGCLIADNKTAAIRCFRERNDAKINISLMNCTILSNAIDNNSKGGFIDSEILGFSPVKSKSPVTIKNCVIYNNGVNSYISPDPASVSYSIVPNEPELAGKTNLVVNPQVYRNPFQPKPTSPAVNGGDPNTNPKDLPATDLDGNPRFQGRIDIGAYERDVLPNRAPYALTHPDEDAIAGIPMLSGGQEAYFFDPEDKPLSLTALGLPANLSLVRNDAGSYAISGTPQTNGVWSVTLTAKDPEGLTASLTFQLVVDTAPVTFQLVAPTYNCQTGAFTFNTAGGDGDGPIEYQASGITGWTANPNQYVDQSLRTADDVQPFTLLARQKGVVVSYTWNLKAACGRGRVAAQESNALSLKVLGNPVSGETAQVAISGVDGQALTLTLVDGQGKSVSTEQIDQATTETRTIKLGESAGVYLLRASTPTQSWTVRVVKK